MADEKHKPHEPDVNEEAITGKNETSPPAEYKGPPIELDTAMDTESDEDIDTIEDEFAGQMTEIRARRILREAEPEEETESEEQEG